MNFPNFGRAAGLLIAAVLVIPLAGCVMSGSMSQHERGWIGGEYKLASAQGFKPDQNETTVARINWRYRSYGEPAVPAFPTSEMKAHDRGILITALASNTPASLGGLQAGDLILEIDGQPVKGMAEFRQIVDGLMPGRTVRVAIWRDDQQQDLRVTVGRERFERAWNMGTGFPTYWEGVQPIPAADFSLGVLGSVRVPDNRLELASPETKFSQKYAFEGYDFGKYQPMDDERKTWLVLFEVVNGKRIVAQEVVKPETAELDSQVEGK